MVETGTCRARNASDLLIKNVLNLGSMSKGIGSPLVANKCVKQHRHETHETQRQDSKHFCRSPEQPCWRCRESGESTESTESTILVRCAEQC